MITGKKRIVLADITSNADSVGDRHKAISKTKKLVANVELVGINTAQLGQVQGFNLAFSVEIMRVQYDNEKYLYFDGKVYEVKSMSKAKDENNMLLNVEIVYDTEIKNAIEGLL
jgi:saccharopine dehydrogenase-like NADP-dependent oxidoreductase